ncbi:hypothetical protein B0G73_1112 [Paraburkholderia sp. BL25I1N1]|nr:hypothetical protein B0G73_1112 [Paraburkholderia sp. BL25I1N1]
MKFEAITFASLCSSLEAEFKYRGVPEATKVSLIAEHIRGVVDSASISDGEDGPAEVSSQKLAMEVRRRVAPLFAHADGDGQEFSVSGEIDAMVHLDEIWGATTGGYAVSPPRLLAIDDTMSLLIGGGATRVLPKAIRKDIEQAGRARILTMSSSLDAEFEGVPEQTLQSWLGLPRESAHSWSTDFLESIKLTGPLDDEAENLLVLNERSWGPVAKCTGPLGRRLARRAVSIYGNPSFQYYLCNLKARAGNFPAVESLARIDRQEARRLQPFMSSSENCRPTVRCETSGPEICIELSWPLPEPENKLLHLGWMYPVPECDNPWPQKYYFSAKLYPFLANALDILGYSLNIHTS